MIKAIPASGIVATRDRADALLRTLESLCEQEIVPQQLIVVDASCDDKTRDVVEKFRLRVKANCRVEWRRAGMAGAACQRNEGYHFSAQPFVWFFDDDIVFQPRCIERLWNAIELSSELGGVSAMIVNQQYGSPGLVSRGVFSFMHGRREKSFGGKVIGPAINLLPEDRQDLPEVVGVDWLNTTCTVYRRSALPSPPFDSFFVGYSLFEDVALSLRVGRGWQLANVRTACIRHESEVGSHKANVEELSRMELTNRYYVMTEILQKRRVIDFVRFVLWEIFVVVTTNIKSFANFRAMLRGKFKAVLALRAADLR